MSTGEAPEQSKFSRRCTLLSRYLKEKGSFGDIEIGLARKYDLELAGKSHLRGQQNAIKKAETSKTRPLEFIQKLSVGEGQTGNVGLSEPVMVVPEHGNSQLTIFFGGKVLVYNEFPQDKAKEIMEVAKEANHVAFDSKNKSNVVIPDLNEPTSSGNNDEHQTKEQNQVVERIARRASLHRFFTKRKDRAMARAPYQVNQNGGHLPPKTQMVDLSAEPGQSSKQPVTPPKSNRHNDMWMEVNEAQCSKDLELKL